jgi:hypothetical protein
MERPLLASPLLRRHYPLFGALVAFGLSTFAELPSAHAWESYPDILKEFGAPNPTCGVCHINPKGSGAHTAFGKVIADASTLTNVDKLRTLLGMLKASNHDTDGDGVPDLTEIAAGTDPSVGNGTGPALTATAAPTPTPTVATPATPSASPAASSDEMEYGCVGSMAGRRAPSRGIELLTALFVAAALWRSRSRVA